MSEHSTGSWRVEKSRNNRLSIYARREGVPGRKLIATAHIVASGAEREANAHLIAAAPALLNALELALAQMEKTVPGIDQGMSWHADMAIIRQAIAQAKGETP